MSQKPLDLTHPNWWLQYVSPLPSSASLVLVSTCVCVCVYTVGALQLSGFCLNKCRSQQWWWWWGDQGVHSSR